MSTSDFPVTRGIMAQLPAWIRGFVNRLERPIKAPVKDSFRWEPPSKDAPTLQVAKAVRIASGLRAAMILADARHTAEVFVILRTVADFSAEIEFVAEGMLEDRFIKEQEDFIRQHFEPPATDPDELAAREREYYVGRKAIEKSLRRIAEKAGAPADKMVSITAFLNKGYDSFVHGANHSAMELFTGGGYRFMMTGHESDRFVCMAKVGVAAKLKEALNALSFMAMSWRLKEPYDEFRSAYDRLDASKEDAGAPCVGLT
jgi:hypothetical protein